MSTFGRSLFNKIKPAVDLIKVNENEMSDNSIEKVSVQNVKLSIERIRKESQLLSEMESNGEIEIVGAIYSVASGKVEFFKS